MRLWEATEATVSAADVIEECKRHHIAAELRNEDRAIIEIETGDVVARADTYGDYAGSDVLDFLGY